MSKPILLFETLLCLCFLILVSVPPIGSLFLFLSMIVISGAFLVAMNVPYLGFLLISVYGGAIVVLFSMVLMLLNKKLRKR